MSPKKNSPACSKFYFFSSWTINGPAIPILGCIVYHRDRGRCATPPHKKSPRRNPRHCGKKMPRFEAGLRRVSQHGVFRSAPLGQPAKAATVPALRSGSNPTVRLTLNSTR